jgi:hypothetical protein
VVVVVVEGAVVDVGGSVVDVAVVVDVVSVKSGARVAVAVGSSPVGTGSAFVVCEQAVAVTASSGRTIVSTRRWDRTVTGRVPGTEWERGERRRIMVVRRGVVGRKG